MDFANFNYPPAVAHPIRGDLRRTAKRSRRRETPHPHGEGMWWNFLLEVAKYDDVCIDEYRAKYGKLDGDKLFFQRNKPTRPIEEVVGNMLLIGGASLLLECLMGNGTATSGQTLTYMNSTNAYVVVGDGAPSGLTGTASVTNGSGSVTTSSSQSSLIGHYLTFTGDSTGGVYLVTAGATTAWTISPVYGGTTAGTAAFSKITGEIDTQTDLQGSSNKARNIVDASFPYHLSSGGGQAITGATNATPIVITSTNSYATGDFVFIQGVLGNLGANGLFQISSASGSGYTLNNSVGTGTYTASTGVGTKQKVLVIQSTFGTGAGNFPWNEWGLANASSGGTVLNRKVAGLGTKTSAASWAFKAAVALA